MRYSDDGEGCYVLVVEGVEQGPMVMETEAEFSSYSEARKRLRYRLSNRSFPLVRACIARLTFVDGNELVLSDLKRLQKEEPSE